jgi:hypothetical protein
MAYGPIPAGLDVLHVCDHPPCVYHGHLFLGTDKDNQQDAIKKGRFHFVKPGRGEDNHNAKLTRALVRTMQERYASGQTQASLARIFGMHPSTVSYAIRGKTWEEVTHG